MEHAGHLAAHDAAHLHVAFQHGPAQSAQRDLLQLFQSGAPLLQSQIFPGHLVFQHPDRAADGAAGDHGVGVLGLEDGLLVVFVDGALLACQEAGAHLDAAGAQGEGCCGLTAVGNAAGCHHGNADGVDDLGHQGHGGHLTHVAAGLGSFGDDGVHPQAL